MRAATPVLRSLQQYYGPRNQLEVFRHFRILSTDAVPSHESSGEGSEKMVSEGGGSKVSFQEKREEINASTNSQMESAGQPAAEKGKGSSGVAQSVTESVQEQGKNEVKASEEVGKDMSGKVLETAGELKDVGVEAARSIKRDATRATEKMGLQDAAETAEELKEVGVEAGKAVKRDAGRVAEKMGLQNAAETAEELKEVGIEAGKAAKRDAGRVAEKMGLQNAAETAEELKEVGVEAGKAAKRDTERIAEKVGVKQSPK